MHSGGWGERVQQLGADGKWQLQHIMGQTCLHLWTSSDIYMYIHKSWGESSDTELPAFAHIADLSGCYEDIKENVVPTAGDLCVEALEITQTSTCTII